MGKLVEGIWHDVWYETKASNGRFQRKDAQFRNWVTLDGSPGPNGEKGYIAESGRYHLYVNLACPWAHRALIFRKLKGLEKAISVSIVHWRMKENGWEFHPGDLGSTEDHLYNMDYLHQIYTKADPHYTGRVTVPVLWDKKEQTIVSNESAEIIRMLNSSFDAFAEKEAPDFYPATLHREIDQINQKVYHAINNGVYKCGFATSQEAYSEAFKALFAALDELESRLDHQKYLAGDQLTEADWRLFTTLVRFDPVYFGHFKCNKKRLVDYPNLWALTRELYQYPGVAETVNIPHIKAHYYGSHETINPTGIIPEGPEIDYNMPHKR
ncbi:glutathione S-transferase family protein [Kiloniella laminariae]|uniref:Glutathione S-transferase family protein n=1 Tax=Kiloniella laminariae TaxID=454162 RepID=A0ABT4LNC9_9PROT|nr:glutathione S-transferase family protein [Kiloniella laminariae]MCZ4281836.1 glutathione S-transferase family protein [Kiloniella laminariae]